MSITMRIIQQFDAPNESAFMELEKKFAELERTRKDFPKGKRMQPISAADPCNTLIWQCEFPTIEAAHATLGFFNGDADHEKLLVKQLPFFRQVRVEFLNNLDF
jgi:hypothetical protein